MNNTEQRLFRPRPLTHDECLEAFDNLARRNNIAPPTTPGQQRYVSSLIDMFTAGIRFREFLDGHTPSPETPPAFDQQDNPPADVAPVPKKS